MFNDVSTSVIDISSEQLDELFKETPDSTPTADDLPLGKTKETAPGAMDVPVIDLDNLEEPKDEEEEEKEDKKPEAKADDKPAEDKSKTTPEDKGKEGEDKQPKLDDSSKDVLKNTINYLVDNGIFKDFEGRDTLEVTEETYAELFEKQIETLVNERYESRKKSSGEYGEAILDYLDKGGDPDQIIDLFKERQAIIDFQAKDDEDRKDMIVKWYKEMHNWKPEKIKQYVDMLIAKEGGIEAEYNEVKDQYDAYYKEQISDLNRQQDLYVEDQKKRQKAFESNLTKAIDDNQSFDDRAKKLIKDSLFRFKEMEDGSKVNNLYVEFAKIQKDPALYVEFAQWVLDRDAYIQRKSLETNNKQVDKKFNFIKKNAAVSTNKGSSHIPEEVIEDNKGSYRGTNFGVLLGR